ncbi:hypothetical protein [Micromonospora craniellae]|uniref:hypothetical protein n=1 Tax=Micromonospora craniellae TaxID=2294034 RepID=UPI00168BB853|nr:hypothetical protein [Micromonospora craniellae]QOC95422.1 hypothetical protein ID554_02460 [Micromonospora craniellae]
MASSARRSPGVRRRGPDGAGRHPVELSVLTDFDFSDEDRDDPTAPGRIAPAAERAEALTEIVAAVAERRTDPGQAGEAGQAVPAVAGDAAGG